MCKTNSALTMYVMYNSNLLHIYIPVYTVFVILLINIVSFAGFGETLLQVTQVILNCVLHFLL